MGNVITFVADPMYIYMRQNFFFLFISTMSGGYQGKEKDQMKPFGSG